jgi:hypothetical protein
MNFIRATQCATQHTGGQEMFPHAGIVVSLYIPNQDGKNKPEIRIAVSQGAASMARFKTGDRVDIGIAYERGCGWILVEAVQPDQRAPCVLHQKNGSGSSRARLRCAINVRPEWKMQATASIPLMPCDNEQIKVGQITARLPKSWERLFT